MTDQTSAKALELKNNKTLKMILLGGSALLFLLQAIASFGSAYYFFELFSHFQEFYFYCTIFGCCFALFMKNKAFICVHALLIVYNLYLFYPFMPSIDTPKPSESILKVYQANILTYNKKYGKLLAQVESLDPDLVILIETNDVWYNATMSLGNKYPFHTKSLKSNNFGFIIYSKTNILKTDVDDFGTGIDCINALIEWDNQTIRLIAAHPPPPTSKRFFQIRNTHLEMYASIINADPDTPAILCGDLNITPWSYQYKDLLSKTTLKSTRHKKGVLSTWPANSPYRIPIDHCLVTKHFQVFKMTVLPDIGSDHLPALNEIYLDDSNDDSAQRSSKTRTSLR